MSKITNNCVEVMETVDANRTQIEHRAIWMGLIYDEMVKAGIDAEPILRRAITRCGEMDGTRIKAACKDPADAADFTRNFLGTEHGYGAETFEQYPIVATKDDMTVDFHYCPLVSGWQKCGFDDATCATLCDIAMDGDRGIAKSMGMVLDLSDTIAKGCPTCKLHFHK